MAAIEATFSDISVKPHIKRVITEARSLQQRLVALLGLAATLAALGFMINRVSQQGSGPIIALIGSGFWFWVALIASVVTEPMAEYLIMRRLLGIGSETLAPLLRKQSLNTLLFSYAGDTLFLAWLQKHIGDTRVAFKFVCNLTISSAFVNNIITLGLLLLIWKPIQPVLSARIGDWPMLIAITLTMLPLVLMIWRCRTMPIGELGFLISALSVRTIAHCLLVALAWHLALPQVSLLSLLMLTTGRMVVSRLPIIPNKEIAFAALAATLLGSNQQIVPVIAGVALLTLVIEALFLLVPSGSRTGRAIFC